MFSVIADGPRRHRLDDGTGTEVGWIRGRAIGFRGLRNKADAIAAASAGWRSLQALLHRGDPYWPRQVVDWDDLRFVHDGAHEWVSDGRIPLARLQRVRRHADEARTDDAPITASARELAVEFVVPSWMDDDAMIPIAHMLWKVLATLLRVESGTANETPEHLPGRHACSSPGWSSPSTSVPLRSQQPAG